MKPDEQCTDVTHKGAMNWIWISLFIRIRANYAVLRIMDSGKSYGTMRIQIRNTGFIIDVFMAYLFLRVFKLEFIKITRRIQLKHNMDPLL